MPESFELGDDARRQIGEAVRRTLQAHRNAASHREGPVTPRTARWEFFRVTSLTPTVLAGVSYYEGEIILYDGATQTTIADVWGVPSQTGTPIIGIHYPARFVGVHTALGEDPVWEFHLPVAGFSGTKTLVESVECSSNTLTVASENFTIENGLITAVS